MGNGFSSHELLCTIHYGSKVQFFIPSARRNGMANRSQKTSAYFHMRIWTALVAILPLNPLYAADQSAVPNLGRSSRPVWPESPKAPAGAPNIIIFLTDDVGFASSSTFGGVISTPTLDTLANQGLRYNQFNTAATCSPTRAALLTGKNPHAVGMGRVISIASGSEGYNSVIPRSSAMLPRILKDVGYATAAFGKWHLTPKWELSAAGPFDRWPTGQGFDHFYGFLDGDTSLWNPNLVQDTAYVEAPPEPNYHFESDMADKAISWISAQKALAPDRPFFLYYATGTAHAPLHAPGNYIERFRGKFDSGWDRLREQIFARQKARGVIPANAKLTPRPPELPAWNSLSPSEKAACERLMEAYAGSLTYADAQIGRVISFLKDQSMLENTLVIFIQGDNGSSAEGGRIGYMFEQEALSNLPVDTKYLAAHLNDIGGPNSYPMLPAGWAWAMSTPFKYYKQIASHFGSMRNGLVISWPKGIHEAGGSRSQFHYVTDIFPTILDIIGVTAPDTVDGVKQTALDGVSMRYSFTSQHAFSHRNIQYFEANASLGIYANGWVAAMHPYRQPWEMAPKDMDVQSQTWELYRLSDDFSEADDLASSYPERLKEMKDIFWSEARRNKVLPIETFKLSAANGRPTLGGGRDRFVLPSGMRYISQDAAPSLLGRSFEVKADLTVPEKGAKGVIVAQGGRYGGWSFYMHEQRLKFYYNAIGSRQYSVTSERAVGPGFHRVAAVFTPDNSQLGSGGNLNLLIDGQIAGTGRIEATLRRLAETEGLDVGADMRTAVSSDYTSAESSFSGTMSDVVVQIQESGY